MTTPSGIYMRFLARSVGHFGDKINEVLEDKYKENMSNKEALKLGMSLFKKVLEEDFDVNRFDVNMIEIKEPDKFPIFEKKIESYNDFQVNEFKNPFLKGNDRKIIERTYEILKNKLDSGEMDYECIEDIQKITGDAAMYPSWGGDGTFLDSITIIIYKDGKRLEVKDTLDKGYVISISDEDEEDEEINTDWNDINGLKRVKIKNSSYKFERLIKRLCNNKKKYDKEKNKNYNDEDFLDFLDENIGYEYGYGGYGGYGSYNFKSEKDIKNEMDTKIKDILNPFTMSYIFDYKITNFIIDIFNKNTKIEVTIFGFGSALGNGRNSQDALLKLIFEKKKDIWQVSYKKSKSFRKMQNRTTEYKLDNLITIRKKILNYLNKK